MERLTKYICDHAHGAEGVRVDNLTGDYCRGEFEATAIVDRLAAIEDILGDEYDLEQLRKLWFADQKGHCVVFDENYPMVSEYYRYEEGWYIRESSGVISETEYKKVMGDG